MPKITKRQLLTSLSVAYLLALTILAAFALHETHYYSLPIPNVHSALTVALPTLSGIALETLITFRSRLAQPDFQTSKIFQAVTAAFLVYEVILATLAGTHIAPLGGLKCPLQDKWLEMRRGRDADGIKRIQDAFGCCGFNGPQDMAWPFPDKTHGNDACMVRYEREEACIEPWRTAERKVAIILLVVPVAVFLWKLALFVVPGVEANWLPSGIRLPSESGAGSGRPRAAITYRDIEDEGEADSLREEVNQLNKDSNLATHVEAGRVRPSPLIQEAENMWRSD